MQISKMITSGIEMQELSGSRSVCFTQLRLRPLSDIFWTDLDSKPEVSVQFAVRAAQHRKMQG